MNKKITKRDLVVVQCVLAYNPNVAGITIKRYVSTDHFAPEYETAVVSVPGLPGEIRVKVKEEMGGQWIPISISTEEGKYFVLRGIGGMALRKR